MSTDTAQSLAEQIDTLKAAARECGPLPDEPFIQMAFLSLPVIPALKLTSQGLFDGEVCLHYAGSHGIIKKARRHAGQKSPVTFMPLSTAEFFLAADFAFFHHRHYRHQADTTNRGDIQRGEGACPAGKAKYRRPIGNHSQT